MLDESRAEVSGPLDRVQDFINSEDLDQRTDALTTPDELTSWLVMRGLLEESEQADARDLEVARRVREALRALALANNGGAPSSAPWTILNGASVAAGMQVRFGPEGAQLAPSSGGVAGALGRLLVDVYAAMQDGTWQRLKACRDSRCHWAFYDRSKNQSRAWCSMAECGNRAKTRAYRRRSNTTQPHHLEGR
jgi:predicted RNA-binding Zn ribbon-like protein